MDDDMNISAVLAAVFNVVRRINALIRENALNRDDAAQILKAFRDIDSVLKVLNFDNPVSSDEVQQIIEARDNARTDGNWKLSDELRDRLAGMGVSVRDKGLGN